MEYRTETQLRNELDAVWALLYAERAERDALLADAERLNWLESQREAYGFQDIHEGNRWTVDGPFATVREAIDAAMKGTP